MKRFIAGLIVGVMLSVLPLSAAIEEYICYKADYKLIIQGQEFVNEELPLLNYKGYTYGPLRPMLEAAGLEVNWNAELGQAEANIPTPDITNESEVESVSTSAMEYDPVTGLPIGAEYIETEENNIKFKLVSYNDDIFVSSKDLEHIYNIKRGTLDVKNGTRTFYKDNQSITVNLRSSDYFNANGYSYYRKSLFESIIEN